MNTYYEKETPFGVSFFKGILIFVLLYVGGEVFILWFNGVATRVNFSSLSSIYFIIANVHCIALLVTLITLFRHMKKFYIAFPVLVITMVIRLYIEYLYITNKNVETFPSIQVKAIGTILNMGFWLFYFYSQQKIRAIFKN